MQYTREKSYQIGGLREAKHWIDANEKYVFLSRREDQAEYDKPTFFIMTTSVKFSDMKFLEKYAPNIQSESISAMIDNGLSEKLTRIRDAWFYLWGVPHEKRRSVMKRNSLDWAHISEGPSGYDCHITHADWKKDAIHRNLFIQVPFNLSIEKFKDIVQSGELLGPSWLRETTLKPAVNSIYAAARLLTDVGGALSRGALSMPPLNSDAYLDDELYGYNRIKELWLPFEGSSEKTELDRSLAWAAVLKARGATGIE
jgi:hypothetical protein